MVGFNHSATVVNPLIGRSGPKEPGHGPPQTAYGTTVGPVVVQDSMIVICVPAAAITQAPGVVITQGVTISRPEAANAIIATTGPIVSS